jgi:Mrp family chromosome partitioning ATPase
VPRRRHERLSTEVLQSQRFLQLLKTFKESFDIVLVDTAPAGLFPEAFLLADEMDRTLYIVEHNRVPRAQVRRILERIGRTRTHIAGVVFNKVKGQHSDLLHTGNYGYNMQAGGRTYSKYYRHYYGRRVG